MKSLNLMNTLKEFTDNLIKKYLFIFLLLGLATKAQARFMVEPHIDNISGKFSIVAGNEGTFTGTSYGLRLGYLGDYFMAGINVEKGHFTYDSQVTSYGYQYFQGGGVGTYLGFHFLDHWRIWTGYLNSTLEAVSQKDYRYFGQQISLGLGYRITGGWMLNYLYYNNYFTQYEDDITGKTGSLANNVRVIGHALSLSFIAVF